LLQLSDSFILNYIIHYIIIFIYNIIHLYLPTQECPEATASFFSQMIFWWYNGMILLGYKKPLTKTDMWKLSKENTSQENARKLYKNLLPDESESDNDKKSGNNSNFVSNFNGIMLPVINTFKFTFIIAFVLQLINSFIMFANPIILNMMISYMKTDTNDDPEWRGYLYAGLFFFASMIESLVFNHYDMQISLTSMRIRSCLMNVIYKKVCITN
jgi:hypothetical protein